MAYSSSYGMPRWLNAVFWGNSVALSWMWGLGLFFSVQFTVQFGIWGLLSFAVPNALGLAIFGFVTQRIAWRKPGGESLAEFYAVWARPFRLIFFLYQLLAITLTVFAVIRYLWQPLGLQPAALYLPLTVLMVLAAGSLFGEECDIGRIKYSHAFFCGILLASVLALFVLLKPLPLALPEWEGAQSIMELKYWGYLVPICIGLILGPWLDLQQWQRAIQIHRERASISGSYAIGALFFFCMLLFHGFLAQWACGQGARDFVRTGIDKLDYAQDLLTRFIWNMSDYQPWVSIAYFTFLCVCILTTLDSGYVAIKWFMDSNASTSKNVIFSIIPVRLITSPALPFIFAGVFTIFAVVVKLELEYFMIFYATFFVGYAALGISRCFKEPPTGALPQTKMFCVGSLAVVICSYGYFQQVSIFQIIASLLPLSYVFWILLRPRDGAELDLTSVIKDEAAHLFQQVRRSEAAPRRVEASESDFRSDREELGGHFEEDNWFIHRFITTYADTNSVGNVYFGMYAMWVGKARELFFNKVLPEFDLDNTDYYILTRSFEHKFMREAKEFETITVKLRIGEYNRKFTTLEHCIYDSDMQVLGKGSQSLMFVSSADYKLIDIPQEVYTAFVKYT